MASVAFHHFKQFRANGTSSCSARTAATRPGEQARDFVYVDDVVAVNLWFLAQPGGVAASSTWAPDVPSRSTTSRVAVVNAVRAPGAARRRWRSSRWSSTGLIEYIDFPQALVGKYQCFTQADLGRLRGAGCNHAFADVARGMGLYAAALKALAR